MTLAFAGFLGACAVIWLLWVLFLRWDRADQQQMLAEFAHKWPDRCPICAFDRAALRDGVVMKPRAHECLERRPLNEASPCETNGHEPAPADK